MNEDENEAAPTLLTPGVAASQLGISGAALRRMATVYEEMHGPLPDSGSGRLWPVEAVERLRGARALMASGKAKSIRDGLRAVEAGAQVSGDATPMLARDVGTQSVLLDELRALRREVEAMRGELSELRALPPGEVATGERLGEQTSSRSDSDGVLVKLARRLERLLGRR